MIVFVLDDCRTKQNFCDGVCRFGFRDCSFCILSHNCILLYYKLKIKFRRWSFRCHRLLRLTPSHWLVVAFVLCRGYKRTCAAHKYFSLVSFAIHPPACFIAVSIVPLAVWCKTIQSPASGSDCTTVVIPLLLSVVVAVVVPISLPRIWNLAILVLHA